ncbi:hypothetical protein [Cellvibrio sp. UBA7671]|uniref:hypothetical protein n=1 Tax=Cellvibrio sp. UBA7671 TaxID=1946312 RepID=UPI002F351D62
MSTLEQRIKDLSTVIATECKILRTLLNGKMVDLSALNTANKTNLVAAINELKVAVDSVAGGGGASINDALSDSTTSTWSITKIASEITAGLNGVLAGAPAALDTLQELANALNNDANFVGTMTAALSSRVRTDINTQGLTLTQKQNARTNIAAYGADEIGDPDTNFVTTFTAGLV